MEIVINGVSHTIIKGTIEENIITALVLKHLDEEGKNVFYVARYSDPYCGKKSKIILDAINQEPYLTNAKKFINGINNAEN